MIIIVASSWYKFKLIIVKLFIYYIWNLKSLGSFFFRFKTKMIFKNKYLKTFWNYNFLNKIFHINILKHYLEYFILSLCQIFNLTGLFFIHALESSQILVFWETKIRIYSVFAWSSFLFHLNFKFWLFFNHKYIT